jgi:hypothetical protein
MIYAYVPADEQGRFAGKPSFAFAIDPTAVVPVGWLSAQGMQLIPQMKEGQQVINSEGKLVFDMWDWIGENNYPNPMDWFMEITKLGFHQLVQRTFEFDKLTPESNYIGVHARANIVPVSTLYERMPDEPACPRLNKDHRRGTACQDTCFSLLDEDLVDMSVKPGEKVTRQAPSFTYTGWTTTLDQKPENYQPAAFIKLPLGRLCQFLVYKDKETDTHKSALEELKKLDGKLARVKLVEL